MQKSASRSHAEKLPAPRQGFLAGTSIRYEAPKNQNTPKETQHNGAIDETMTFPFYPQTLSRRK